MMKRPNKYDFDFSEDYESNLETYCDELEKISSTLSKSFSESMFKIYQLNKALDKACEELENFSYKKGIGQDGMCYKEWKEWLIKDE